MILPFENFDIAISQGNISESIEATVLSKRFIYRHGPALNLEFKYLCVIPQTENTQHKYKFAFGEHLFADGTRKRKFKATLRARSYRGQYAFLLSDFRHVRTVLESQGHPPSTASNGP